MKRSARISFALMLAATGAAFAQAPPAPAPASPAVDRFERQLEQIQRDTRLQINPAVPPEQRAFFDYGAYLTLSYLSADDSAKNNHTLWEPTVVGYARAVFDGAQELMFRGRVSYRDYSPGDSFDDRGDRFRNDVELAYYRFDLAKALNAYSGKSINGNVAITAGRQLIDWGSGLTLDQFVDGALVNASYGPVSLDVLAGVTNRQTIDFDNSRPNYDEKTLRGFYGAQLSTTLGANSNHHPFAYFLLQRDYHTGDTLTVPSPFTNPATNVVTRFGYNSFYIGMGSRGSLTDRLLYSAEVVYEGGSTLSNSYAEPFIPIEQTRDDISAMAFDGRLDFVPGDRRHSRFVFETIAGTGDRDRLNTSNTFSGNRSGTSDHAFNALGLLNTGLAFAPGVSNILILKYEASTFPFPDHSVLRGLQVGGDVFFYNKFYKDAPIEEATQKGQRYLGWELDAFANWQITSDVTFALRYGLFNPTTAIVNNKTRQFIYAGVTFAF